MRTKTFLSAVAIAATIILTGCKTEDPTNNNVSGVLPKKIVETYSGSTSSRTMDFTYSGNKISEILITPAYDVSKIKYTYDGDNIVKIENFAGQNFSKFSSMEFTYQNGKVSSSVYKNSKDEVQYNYTFTHNATDNTVTVLVAPAIQGYSSYQQKYYLKDGNIVKLENSDLQKNQIYYKRDYTYDLNKFNYAKNITGLLYTFSDLSGGVNSLTKMIDTTISSSTGQESSVEKQYTYEYNSDGYPTKMTETNGTRIKTSVITY